MNKLAALGVVAFLLTIGSAVADDAKEVTLVGAAVCAKCTLHEEGLTECQNVLLVEANGQEQRYYLSMNSVNEEFGDVCMLTRQVQITGTISERDGHTWIAASRIDPVDDPG